MDIPRISDYAIRWRSWMKNKKSRGYDACIQQVWEWKKKVHEETKDMDFVSFMAYARKKASEMRKSAGK